MLSVLLIVTLLCCWMAYRYYGRRLDQWVGIDPLRMTPAHELKDGNDFVPSGPAVVFGHHFASIAGAGPIIGPIIAAEAFGWAPTWLWVILGVIFVGGVHDVGATLMSLRHKGRSMTEACSQLVGKRTGMLFMGFVLVALIYVIIVFLDITAAGFVESPGVATASGWFMVTAVGFGLSRHAGWLSPKMACLVFIPLTYAGIWIGESFQLPDVSHQVWLIAILLYCAVAALLPVNWLMQPRDFLSATFLYAIVVIGVLGVLISGGNMGLPAFKSAFSSSLGPIIPFLFITVACGACSGFHSIVASGTTSKQLSSEADVRPVAYGSMLMEGVLATFAIACLGILGGFVKGGPMITFAEGAAHFFGLLGIPQVFGKNLALLAIATFLLTTLDTTVRLTRFIMQEFLGSHPFGRKKIALTVGLLGVTAFFAFQTYGGVPAWKLVWPLFGATNQLLASLALVTFVVFQKSNHKPWGFVLIPAALMAIMPMASLALMCLLGQTIPEGLPDLQKGILRVMAGGLFAVGFVVMGMSVRTLLGQKGHLASANDTPATA